ncbi:MAG: hypothetical protein HYZ65_06250 [Burkholderiales bacterium]|nr:hypothetical protein [Burkholderiales bacterium]
MKKIVLVSTLLLCSACSPKFDWREIRGNDAPYTVLLPGKPTSFSKDMLLDGVELKMTMTASEAGGVSFAVGSAKLGRPEQAPHVLDAMKAGMVSNIHGKLADGTPAGAGDIEIHGQLQNGAPVLLVGRFVARGPWVYQAVIMGPERAVSREVIDTFMTSFKTN